MKTKLFASMILASVCGAAGAAEPEQRFAYKQEIDAISGREVRSVVVVSSDNLGSIFLRVDQGQKPVLGIVPAVVIRPDKTNDDEVMVRIAHRSTNMEKPSSNIWRMRWMNYKSATIPSSGRGCVEVFEGDSVTFQIETIGKRMTVPTRGEGCEGLQDAVARVLEIAAPDPAPAAAQSPASKPHNHASDDGRRAGNTAVQKAGVHASQFGDREVMRQANAAAKSGKLDGEDADAFVVGYVSAFKAAH